MTPNRSRALVLVVVLGLFMVAIVDMLIFMMREDAHEGVLTSRQYARLQEQVVQKPGDTELRDRVRALDLQLRREHETRLWRVTWARRLLPVAIAAWVLALHWYMSTRPKAPPTVTRDKKYLASARIRMLAARNHSLIACTILGVAVVAGLGVLGLGDRHTLPAPGWQPTPPTPVSESGTPDPGQGSPYTGVWPGFRGPGGYGVASDGDWPTTWSVATGNGIRWTTDVPLSGKSSPAVWRDHIFLATADANQQRVLCYSRSTGALVWNKLVPAPAAGARGIEIYESTGYAAPTPATDGQRVYALFPTGVLVAFDFDGNRVWLEDMGAPESIYSFASSPIVYNDLLLVQYDQGAEADAMLSEIIAFDGTTGKIRYSVPRSVPNSWSSPCIIQTANRTALITTANPWVIAYNPVDGAEYWRVSGLSGDIGPSPAYGDGVVFATNDGASLLAIRTGGEGDVTETHLAWQAYQGMPDTSSPLSDGKRVLQVAAGGGLTCFDAATGNLLWEEWLESGANASPILASGRVYLACDDGVTRIFAMGDKMEMVGKGDVGLPIYATPAFADNEIILRAKGKLFCIGANQE